jgi:hypothetical protein
MCHNPRPSHESLPRSCALVMANPKNIWVTKRRKSAKMTMFGSLTSARDLSGKCYACKYLYYSGDALKGGVDVKNPEHLCWA